ncbi:hypothetical protein ACOSP7_000184 [Xanthoceras sorbifolium]
MVPKTKVHQPRIRIFRWFYEFVFPFLSTYTSFFSSLSFFFFFLFFFSFLSYSSLFFFFFFFSFFLSFFSALSLSFSSVLFSRFCEKLLLFFIFFSLPRPSSRPMVAAPGRDAHWNAHTAFLASAPWSREWSRCSLPVFDTFIASSPSRPVVAVLTARFCVFHRERAIATCDRGDQVAMLSGPVFQFFIFHFFFTIQSDPLEIIK